MADSMKEGTEVQALDHDTGVWTSASIVEVDPLTRQAFISFHGWSSQWNRWTRIGSIKEEVVAVLDQLGESNFRRICQKGYLDRSNCLPGPRHFHPSSTQTKTVMLLEWLDKDSELSDRVVNTMTALRIDTQGESFIRTMELLVWKVYSAWITKGFLRPPIAERVFPRRLQNGAMTTSSAKTLKKGDTVVYRSGPNLEEGTVQTNDPFLGYITLSSESQKKDYEDLVSKDWVKTNKLTTTRDRNNKRKAQDTVPVAVAHKRLGYARTQTRQASSPSSVKRRTNGRPLKTPVASHKRLGTASTRIKHASSPSNRRTKDSHMRDSRHPNSGSNRKTPKTTGIKVIAVGQGTVNRPSIRTSTGEQQPLSLHTTPSTCQPLSETSSPLPPAMSPMPQTPRSQSTPQDPSSPSLQQPLQHEIATSANPDRPSPTGHGRSHKEKELHCLHSPSTPLPLSPHEREIPAITPQSSRSVLTRLQFLERQIPCTRHAEESSIEQRLERLEVAVTQLNSLFNAKTDAIIVAMEALKRELRKETEPSYNENVSEQIQRRVTNRQFWELRPVDVPININDETITEAIRSRQIEDVETECLSQGSTTREALAREIFVRMFTLGEIYNRNVRGHMKGGRAREAFDKTKMNTLFRLCFRFFPSQRIPQDTRLITVKLNDFNRQLWCRKFRHIQLPDL